MILFSHPYGAPFVQHASQALANANILGAISTTASFSNEGLVARLPYLSSLFARRVWLPRCSNIHKTLSCEALRIILTRSHIASGLGMRSQTLSDNVFRSLDNYTAKLLFKGRHKSQIQAVYCYEDGAEATFRIARELDIATIYDLPIVHHKTVESIERCEVNHFPELQIGFLSLSDSQRKKTRKDSELQSASIIIVASEVTKRSLLENGYQSDKIRVIPYGSDFNQPTLAAGPTRLIKQNNFKAVFIGRVGPRKGVHRLLQTWKQIGSKHASLTLIGIDEFPSGYLDKNLGKAEMLGPLPYQTTMQHIESADLLILPSLVEGFGLVILEAMSRGVPVLATDATALPELLQGRAGGIVIPSANTQALQERLEWCLSNRSELLAMGELAREIATESTWKRYESAIVKICQEATS